MKRSAHKDLVKRWHEELASTSDDSLAAFLKKMRSYDFSGILAKFEPKKKRCVTPNRMPINQVQVQNQSLPLALPTTSWVEDNSNEEQQTNESDHQLSPKMFGSDSESDVDEPSEPIGSARCSMQYIKSSTDTIVTQGTSFIASCSEHGTMIVPKNESSTSTTESCTEQPLSLAQLSDMSPVHSANVQDQTSPLDLSMKRVASPSLGMTEKSVELVQSKEKPTMVSTSFKYFSSDHDYARPPHELFSTMEYFTTGTTGVHHQANNKRQRSNNEEKSLFGDVDENGTGVQLPRCQQPLQEQAEKGTQNDVVSVIRYTDQFQCSRTTQVHCQIHSTSGENSKNCSTLEKDIQHLSEETCTRLKCSCSRHKDWQQAMIQCRYMYEQAHRFLSAEKKKPLKKHPRKQAFHTRDGAECIFMLPVKRAKKETLESEDQENLSPPAKKIKKMTKPNATDKKCAPLTTNKNKRTNITAMKQGSSRDTKEERP